MAGSVRRRGGINAGCVGCLVVAVLVLVGAGVGGWYVYGHWRDWAATWSERLVVEAVDEFGLAEEEREAVLGEYRAFAEDFRRGLVSLEDLREVGRELSESPIIPAAGVMVLDRRYIETSDLSDEERAEARRVLQRYARGVYERSIPGEDVEETIKPLIRIEGPTHRFKKAEEVSREDLEALIDRARSRADAAGVPDEPFEIDLAKELRAVIDRALGRGGEGSGGRVEGDGGAG